MQIFSSLKQGMRYAQSFLKQYGEINKASSWQGIHQPVDMFEVDNVYFRARMPGSIIALQEQTQPDLPWAEEHFKERVGGLPLNPGEQYKNWPGYKDREYNDTRFRKNEVFSHTYMERLWPKFAGMNSEQMASAMKVGEGLRGIRYDYGDLWDVIDLLGKEPFTRQAYLPIWFPEDTGVKHNGRVPCTIGYHFHRRGDDLNVHYLIRACDFIRHFRNDVYLTVRLGQWVLEQLKTKNDHTESWHRVELGILTMDIINLHVFAQEKNLI